MASAIQNIERAKGAAVARKEMLAYIRHLRKFYGKDDALFAHQLIPQLRDYVKDREVR